MMISTRRRAFQASHAVLLAALAGAAPGLAVAQTGPDARDQLDEVVITATRTEVQLARTPMRVEVISRQDMEDRGYVTLVDALAQTPGVVVVQSGGAGAIASVFSRGTNSKHTLALLDGIRLNDPSAPNGQYNFGQDTVAGLERIEVARGAASSVYGSDAIGGVVNFIPRVGGARPFEPTLEAMLGDQGTWRLAAGAFGDLDRLSYGLSAEHYETDGFNNTPDRFPDGLGEADGSRFDTVTGVVDYRLADTVKLRGLLRWRETRTDLDDSALDRIGRSTRDRYLVWRVGPSFDLLDGRLKVEVNGGEVRNKRSDMDEADANQVFPAPSSQARGVRSFANWRNTYEAGAVAGLSDVVLTGGLEWQREDIEAEGGYSDPLSRAEDAHGLYALARGRAAGRVDLSASVRRDDTDAFGDETTWNLGAVVALPEIGGRLYASGGTSFKAPTLSERFTTSAYYQANPDLKPENGESWEIGFDLRPDGSPAGVGFTYFSSDIENLIEYDFAQLKNINIAAAEIDGYEAYMELAPASFLNLRVNYTYTDARNGDTDDRLLRRPPHAWSALVEYRPSDRLSATLAWRDRGRRVDVLYEDTNPWGLGGGYLGNGWTDSYQVVDLSARYDVNASLTVFGGVTNLFDADYEEPDSYRGAPRAVTVGLRSRF